MRKENGVPRSRTCLFLYPLPVSPSPILPFRSFRQNERYSSSSGFGGRQTLQAS